MRIERKYVPKIGTPFRTDPFPAKKDAEKLWINQVQDINIDIPNCQMAAFWIVLRWPKANPFWHLKTGFG